MRLINCLQYRLEEFFGSHIPPYVILSHTWEDEEVTFADFTRDQAGVRQKRGFQKLAYTCRQAQIDGYQWAWVDTCCIDKSSSAELSEAINSMFAWYKSAEICYVFLTDVVQDELQLTFPRSRWFTRGWTLQELLAPHRLVFYDQYWNRLGTKKEYAKWIAEITTIDTKALVFAPVRGNQRSFKPKRLLSSYCIARRMSWASQRQTTRLEDMSYSLLGLFDISMPLLYGEGARAFLRLHEEIIKRVDDDSILAWNLQMPTSAQGLLHSQACTNFSYKRTVLEEMTCTPNTVVMCKLTY
ncbi:HET-domain-containing protein [Ophiobolus disseminans]|uniref:HET-domain-containing protein n=1 Tax=Ophiobolus disseminans TaxID=1469910 RepID=A0A6A7AJE6_9PLEO|nr:HET-domain-containing protein [Ophiobolus disseminans]